jgi:hypothetical protein
MQYLELLLNGFGEGSIEDVIDPSFFLYLSGVTSLFIRLHF